MNIQFVFMQCLLTMCSAISTIDNNASTERLQNMRKEEVGSSKQRENSRIVRAVGSCR